MGEIFGMAGSIASAAISAGAMKDATQMQIDALNNQRAALYNDLNPDVINNAATGADTERAKNRLALQGITDPALLQARYNAEAGIGNDLSQLGVNSNAVANQATSEALAGVPGLKTARDKLIDTALQELNAGATLPPDVQAEMVRTGLEKTGQMSGAATTQGFGGQVLRRQLGTAGQNLMFQRQQAATGLIGQAQDLETKRQAILGTLFPNLATTQLNTLQGKQSVLGQSDSLVPNAGLGGTDISNIWLARVGAQNQLAQNAANAASQGAMGQAQIWNKGLGSATNYGAALAPSTQSGWNSIFGSSSAPSMSAASSAGNVGGSGFSSDELGALFG